MPFGELCGPDCENKSFEIKFYPGDDWSKYMGAVYEKSDSETGMMSLKDGAYFPTVQHITKKMIEKGKMGEKFTEFFRGFAGLPDPAEGGKLFLR